MSQSPAHSATLKWTQPAQTATEVVVSTSVYRNSVKLVGGIAPATLTYVDSAVAAGATYSYALSNVDSKAVEGPLSPAVTVVIPGTPTPPPPGTSDSLWTASTVPGHTAGNDAASVELGMKFSSSVAGQVTGCRFYKATNSTSAHTCSLWASTGTLLATVPVTGETASGWQQMAFTTPYTVTSGLIYVISYHTSQYAYDSPFFNVALSVPPLAAPVNAGVYTYGTASAFPKSTFNGSNYYADVLFTPSGVTPPPPVQSMTTTCAWPTATDWRCDSILVNVPSAQGIKTVVTSGTLSNTVTGTKALRKPQPKAKKP